jgi:hypothetical protein
MLVFEGSMKSKGSQVCLFRVIASAAFVLALMARIAVAQSRVPQFRDYPVSEAYIGKTAPLILTRDDKTFRTRLRWAAKNLKPNFAGRYILTTWGCGTSCLMGAVIDAKTGKVHWWDFSLCCWGYDIDENFQPIEIRLNSKLIVFSGARNEKDGDIGAHFYKFENGRFVHIRSVLKANQSGS